MPEIQVGRTYATYFDSGYLSRGLTLIESLRSNGDHSEIWVLCLDVETFDFLFSSEIPGVKLIGISALEDDHPELNNLKALRTKAEYIFSIGPTFLLDVLTQHVPEEGILAYLDADLFFFDNPKEVFITMGDSSVGIIEHRYPEGISKKLEKYGKFNVGWVGFRNDSKGRNVLTWWAEECKKWCFDKPLNGLYADQGYLNSFPNFEGVKVLENFGYNAAPWNVSHKNVEVIDEHAFVMGNRLNFFHFHGITDSKNRFYTSQLNYLNSVDDKIIEYIYIPYLRKLTSKNRQIHLEKSDLNKRQNKRGHSIRGILFQAKKKILNVASIMTGNTVLKSRI